MVFLTYILRFFNHHQPEKPKNVVWWSKSYNQPLFKLEFVSRHTKVKASAQQLSLIMFFFILYKVVKCILRKQVLFFNAMNKLFPYKLMVFFILYVKYCKSFKHKLNFLSLLFYHSISYLATYNELLYV